jgi:hypothetical protein
MSLHQERTIITKNLFDPQRTCSSNNSHYNEIQRHSPCSIERLSEYKNVLTDIFLVSFTAHIMTYPRIILPTLEALYRLGTNICDEIEKFHPDVVLGLAHSGWMPVVIAQALWAETKETPFPLSTRTNIGLEKKEIYDEQYGKSTPAFCCGECCERVITLPGFRNKVPG